jgi:hypothetical protein
MSDKTIKHCGIKFEAQEIVSLASTVKRYQTQEVRWGNCPKCLEAKGYGLVLQVRGRAGAMASVPYSTSAWEDASQLDAQRWLKRLRAAKADLVRLPVTSEHTINLSKPVDNPRNMKAVRAYG